MNTLVIGNCQAHSLALCLNLIAPDSNAVSIWPDEFAAKFGSRDEAITFISKFDVVISQKTSGKLITFADTKSGAKQFLLYPNVQFGAFHPDCVYAVDSRPEMAYAGIQSPIGDYNSAIAVYGYITGLSFPEIMRLYNSKVYERLGYFDVWSAAKNELRMQFEDVGYPFDATFARWHREGAFMHSMNHPYLRVAETFANKLAPELGVKVYDRGCVDSMFDPNILGAIYPIYPEIAEHLAVRSGGYSFKKAGNCMDSGGSALLFDLAEFVHGSLESFSRTPRETIACQRVAEWICDLELNAYLTGIAKAT